MSHVERLGEFHDQRAARLIQEAYPPFYSKSDEALERIDNRLRALAKDGQTEIWGVFENGDLCGVALLYHLQVRFAQEIVFCTGIGSVAIDLWHKKKGLAAQLMQGLLKRSGELMAHSVFLYPFSHAFYQSFGFGQGPAVMHYDVQPEHLVISGERERCIPYAPKDKEEVRALYLRLQEKNQGMAYHQLLFERQLFSDQSEHRSVIIEEGKITGYFSFYFGAKNLKHLRDQSCQVTGLLLETPLARRAFIDFLAAQRDQCSQVSFSAPSHEDYRCLFKEIEHGRERRIFPGIHHAFATATTGTMVRLLDIERTLRTLPCPVEKGLRLQIRWPRAGVRIFLWGEGENPVTLTLDLSHASALLWGHETFLNLWHMGCLNTSEALDFETIDTKRMGVKAYNPLRF